MKTLQLYIGSNNDTKNVELDKIRELLTASGFDGWTEIPSYGMWKGTEEYSVIIEVLVDETKLAYMTLLVDLRRGLKQEAIGYRLIEPLQFHAQTSSDVSAA